MKKFLSIPAYLWAIACLLLIPVTFIANNRLSQQLARLPFMKINPIYSGGEIADSVTDQNLKIIIFKPVFEALIGESKKGFVQVKFVALNDTLPEIINEEIDFNFDSVSDFEVEVNTLTGKSELSSLSSLVTGLNVSSRVKKDWVIRAGLLNINR